MNDLNRDIDRYLKDEMTPAERHAFEKKALNDPFLADALEGHEPLSAEQREQDLASLERKIQAASARNRSGWFFPLRIAAGIAVLMGVSWWLFVREVEPTLDRAQEVESAQENAAITEETAEPSESPAMAERIEQPNVVDTKPAPAGKVSPATGGPDLATNTEPQKEDETRAGDGAAAIPQTLKIESEAVNEELAKREVEAETRSKKANADLQRTASPVAMQLVSGQVRSAEDNSPIPGVNVIIKGTSLGTVTDANGNYQLEVPVTQNQLVYSFIGFTSKEEAIKNPTQNDVTLDSDVSQLSEVVVTGYGFDDMGMPKPSEYVTTLPEPEGGRKAYQKYLETNLQYPQQALDQKIEGRVTIQFTVTFDGRLQDFNVIRSLGYGCDEEVIRLIRQGPAWSPSKRNEVTRDSKVRVRMRFKLPDKKG